MNEKKSLVAAAILALLAAVLFLWEMPRQKAAEEKEIEGDKILDIDFDKVNRVELTRGDETLAFVKDGDWRMTAPVEDQAEHWMVQSLISAVRYARPDRVIDDLSGDALQRFGLDQPRGVIAYDNGQVIKRVRIGATNAIGRTVYLKPEDESKVYLVSESSVSALDKPTNEFRRAALLSPNDSTLRIHQLVIDRTGQPPLTLVAEAAPAGDDAEQRLPSDLPWHIDRLDGPVADAEAVRDLLDKVATLNALDFLGPLDELRQSAGLDRPTATVTAVYGEADKEEALTLTLGGPTDSGSRYQVTVTGRPFVFAVHRDKVTPLLIARADLRDRRLVPGLDAAAVHTIDLQSPSVSFTLSRSADGWLFADQTPADAERVQQLLDSIGRWRAESLVDGPRAARLARQVRGGNVTSLTLLNEEGRKVASLRCSTPVDPAAVAPGPGKKTEATPEPGDDGMRRVALVEGGYPGTAYLVKDDLSADLPEGIEEMKAQPTPEPAAPAAEAGAAEDSTTDTLN